MKFSTLTFGTTLVSTISAPQSLKFIFNREIFTKSPSRLVSNRSQQVIFCSLISVTHARVIAILKTWQYSIILLDFPQRSFSFWVLPWSSASVWTICFSFRTNVGPDYLDVTKSNLLKASIIYCRQHIDSLLKPRKGRLWSCGILCEVCRQIIMDVSP